MKWTRNPSYDPSKRVYLTGWALWAWRGVLVLLGGALAIRQNWIGFALLLASWVIAEVLRRRMGASQAPADSPKRP